ncbi:MAG: sensor domain-containing diguanylate cyclase [Halioglobus sp.]|nr:sensor domain-containing diguanylate cyclase [Halioglobus sp.]
MAEEVDQTVGREEIEGAPPALSGAEVKRHRLDDAVTVNRYLYQQTQQLEHMLLEAADLAGLLEILLVSMPRHFSFQVAELWLYDPEDVLTGLIVGGERYGHHLRLMADVYPMQELYELEPDVLLIDATDSRMFEILTSEHGIDNALLMPLLDSGRMIGSLHLGLTEGSLNFGAEEEALLAHLSTVISSLFKLAVSRQQISQLTLLDPLTQISNLRGFEKDIAREISRARRAESPFCVLIMEIDEYDDLYEHYGKRRGQFMVKKVAERISSDLRATDMLARLGRARLAVLIPGSGAALGSEIAERMREDIDDFSMDDGRGAILQVSISVGLVSWEPQHFAVTDPAQLAREMEETGTQALIEAQRLGGNRTSTATLTD